MPPSKHPLPDNEEKRLARLKALRLLDSDPEPLFDEITKAAQALCEVPIALMSLVDESRQWFKSRVGLKDATETHRSIAFCAHTILQRDIMEVADAHQDNRFKANALVTGNPHVRFYAGAPLTMPGGENIGTLCVIDQSPKSLTETQKNWLHTLSKIAVEALLLREKLLHQIELESQRALLLIQNSQDAIITKSLEGVVTSWNKAATEMFGYSENDMVGRPIIRLFPFGKLQEEAHFLNQLNRGDTIRHYKTERLTKSGEPIHVSVSLSPIQDSTGKVIGISKIARDITQQTLLDNRLYAEHEKLRVTLDSIGDAVITTDICGRVEYINPKAERMTGIKSADAENKPIEEVLNIVNENTRQAVDSPIRTCIKENRMVPLSSQSILINTNGQEYPVEDSAAPIRDRNGHLIGAVMVLYDVTTMRQLSREMTYRATHDILTDLYNRTELELRLESILENHRINSPPSALFYLDLDQFKIVNDTSGHAAGDALLKEISLILQKSVRKNDFIARVGGDEFAIILEKCDLERAMKIANAICKNIDHHRFVYHDKKFRVGCSIGVAMTNGKWNDIVSLMQAADNACYAAKKAGRNQVSLFVE